MAGVKISALPAIPSSALTDVAPFVQTGVTYKVTNTQLITLYNTNIQLASTSQVTGLSTLLSGYLPLTGGNMTGVIDMGSHKITSLTDPTGNQDAATKAYVDLHGSGIKVILAAQAATTANLNATAAGAGVGATLTNAGAMVAFAVDGYSASVTDRILVKNQTLSQHNGVYTVTTVGSGAANWVLTRATDYDQNTEIIPGTLVAVNNGTVNAGTSWLETATVVTVDTDPVLFSQFTFSSTSFLQIANNLSDVNNKTTSFNNVSPLTTKGDLIGFSTLNVRLAVGASNGQVLQVASGAATGLAWSTPTYPSASGTARKVVISDGTNNVYSTETWATPGANGNVLTSDGTNWTSGTPASGTGRLIGIQKFTASGTYTPTAGVTNALACCWGAGAGGGSNTNVTTVGGSGGAGAYAEGYVPVAGNVTITIASGGLGATQNTTNNGGSASGDTSYGTTVIAKPGLPGHGANGGVVGGVGGLASACTVPATGYAIDGGDGASSNTYNAYITGAFGGSSPGNTPFAPHALPMDAKANSGAGGGGGSTGNRGGNGGSGLIIVYEYS